MYIVLGNRYRAIFKLNGVLANSYIAIYKLNGVFGNRYRASYKLNWVLGQQVLCHVYCVSSTEFGGNRYSAICKKQRFFVRTKVPANSNNAFEIFYAHDSGSVFWQRNFLESNLLPINRKFKTSPGPKHSSTNTNIVTLSLLVYKKPVFFVIQELRKAPSCTLGNVLLFIWQNVGT